MNKLLLTITVFFFLSSNIYSQNIDNQYFIKKYNSTDSSRIYNYSSKIIKKLRKKGYILTSIDTIIFNKNKTELHIYKGQKFYWQKIDTAPDSVIAPSLQHLAGKPVNFTKLENETENLLASYTNSGYPFAKIIFDTVFVSGNKINLHLTVSKNNFVEFDTIFFDDSKIKISENFLQNYLQFKKGQPYNQKIFEDIDKKIQNIDFLQVNSPAEIEFHENTADLFLYLSQKKSNYFSGIVGFTNTGGKFKIIGQADVKLINLFKNADQISLKWQNTKPQSQNLNFKINLPYIFNTQLGISNNLIIKKIDTTYVNFSNNFQMLYFSSAMNNAGLFTQFKQSIVFDTNSTLNNYKSITYGFSLFRQNLDYPQNPHKGYMLDFEIGAGKKFISDSSSRQLSIDYELNTFLPTTNNFTLHFRQYFFYLKNDYLQENDLFKFGGNSLMRGFDEEDLSCSALLFNSVELRYLFSKNSNAFIFCDYAVYQNFTTTENYYNHPLGIGFGTNLFLNTGLLSISIAIGKDDNAYFNLSETKIHIGYKSYF